ncbi:TraR/DksA C4-type zinc finger protein [Pseudomonas sp. 3A(2025)]
MADVVDNANDEAEYHLQVALRRVSAGPVGSSAHFCDDCDDPIPELRRLAIQGCSTCVDCQSRRERRA